MGKSSGGGGGGAPAGSQTIIQDIAEPFKGFATRSLERAERLQGLPSVPFTGIAHAGPTPDELVAAQALRQRFMEADPLTERALGLQATAADPITAQSIEARRNPFNALIAQEAYRRLDERGQRDLQDLRAREVGAGGTDRGRGVIEASLLRQRQEDQERQIGLEAGQRSFTEASRLAEADRQARGDTSIGISRLLGERQALQRRDIDDLLKVGAQFREQFIQPELDLERQQFVEERGPASTQNPFGFEQFFSGIRQAAPTPITQTTQQFRQTPSGLSQIAPIAGAGIGLAGQFMQEGGEINFDEGGIASFARGQKVNLSLEEQENQAIAHIKDFFTSIENNPNAYSPEVMAELEAIKREFIEQTTGGGAIATGSFADRMRFYESFVDGITNVANPGAPPTSEAMSIAEALRRANAKFEDRPSAEPVQSETKMHRVVAEMQAREREGDPSAIEDTKREWGGIMGRSQEIARARREENAVTPSEVSEVRKKDRPGWHLPRKRSQDDSGITTIIPGEEAPLDYWESAVKELPGPLPPTPGAEDFESVDASFVETEPEEQRYSNADISAMMEYEQSGRGWERLPRHLRGLNRGEMTQELKPIRERARKASEPRRKEERRERFSNRRSFDRNRGGLPKTESYDIDWSEFFDFNKGGIASFDKGGTTDFSGYDYGMGEEAMTRGSMLGGKSLPLVHSYELQGKEDVSEKSVPSQLEKLMALSTRMNRSAPRDQYYPDAPEMTSGQKWKMGLAALSEALMSIKADPETGITDFSDVGRGAMKGMKGFEDELKARRASSVALERQTREDTMKTLTDLQALETSIQSGNKTALETQLLEFELAHPEYKAATQSMSDILRNLMPGAEFPIDQFKAAVNEMRILMGKQAGTAPQGLAGVDSALAGLISKKRKDQDQPKTK
jgi:hypothetical protein